MLKWPRNSRTTCSPSPARIRPWSTKTQVSWSPIASWISTAATAESTPPDRPQMTRPLPTWRLIASRASARKAAIVQSLFIPATLWTKLRISLRAVGRVDDLGMEHQAVVAALLVGDEGEGRVLGSRDAGETGRQAGDAVAVAHPHDVALAGLPHAVEQRARRRRPPLRRGRTRGGGRFRPRRRAARPWSSGRSRCRAPARRLRRSPAARAATPSSGTEAGPPDRITALGFSASKAASALWNGAISQ